MNNQTQTLWQAIEQLARQMPFTPDNVEEVLGTSLTIKTQTPHMTQWVGGGPVPLSDNLHISNSSLALGPGNEFNERSGLSVEVDGGCITLDEVRKQFGPLQISQVPRGHSGNETTVHVAAQPWGRISFGFRASDPACLFRVGIRPAQTG